MVELHDRQGNQSQANDNWRSDQEAEILATTIPPTDERESAIVRTVAPAPGTAIGCGAGDTTGIAVVEVCALD